MADTLLQPFMINKVRFKNRIIRSSVGGRMAYYEGFVNDAFIHFEKMFAEGGAAAVVSPTMTVNDRRWAPIEYPKISDAKFIPRIRHAVKLVQSFDCRYILQIGDPGYHAQSAMFAKDVDSHSSSPGIDMIYGYVNRRQAMQIDEIKSTIQNFGNSAYWVQQAGCDGVEVTISKGYLIHQFLNPGINRRKDEYGGSMENRFRFLAEIVAEIRNRVGRDYLFGVRISAHDYNYLPINIRTPISSYWTGNGLHETLQFAEWLKEAGVDYLHVSNGFGFINPKENPGDFPVREVRMFCNSTRRLGIKAWLRSTVLNSPLGWLTQFGWKRPPQGPGAGPPENLADARVFKSRIGLPVISNGGFSRRAQINDAIESGGCDMVSMARPLLANPDLPNLFAEGLDGPEQAKTMLPYQNRRSECSHCNRCAVMTTIFPVGCFDASRFPTKHDMEWQIRHWAGDPNYQFEHGTEELPRKAAAASAGGN